MSDIRDTTAAMRDELEATLFLGQAMADGPSAPIEAQEAAGQQEMLTTVAIPTRTMHCTDQHLLALGFTLSAPRPDDPLFRDATLPDGWTRVPADDTNLWTYLLDPHGRPRCGVFYKAAWYDRRASINMLTVHAYAERCIERREPPILDEVWATRERVLAELDDIAAYMTKAIENCRQAGDTDLASRIQDQLEACAWVRRETLQAPVMETGR